jgi:hypothetical protein
MFLLNTVVSYIPFIWKKGGGRSRGRDRMVVGFTTIYAISAYHHRSCEFESRSCRGVLDTTLRDKFFSDLWQVGGFLRVLQFPPPIKLTPWYIWNIVESAITHHNPPFPYEKKNHHILWILSFFKEYLKFLNRLTWFWAVYA